MNKKIKIIFKKVDKKEYSSNGAIVSKSHGH
ncbi:hypothetical protein JOC61_000756 [Marinitoga litoralis]|jgi:hypothetical protein|nr:hypothetical protein [Marinitoga litoralis]